MIPKNHPSLQFPLNLEDRVEYLKDQVNKILIKNITFSEKIKNIEIILSFKENSILSKEDNIKLKNLGFELKDKIYSIVLK